MRINDFEPCLAGQILVARRRAKVRARIFVKKRVRQNVIANVDRFRIRIGRNGVVVFGEALRFALLVNKIATHSPHKVGDAHKNHVKRHRILGHRLEPIAQRVLESGFEIIGAPSLY